MEKSKPDKKDLPRRPGPGYVVKVDLDLLPEYLEKHGLKIFKLLGGTLYVVEKEG